MLFKIKILGGIFLISLYLPAICFAYTETFYVCQGGNGSSPESGNCSAAWNADHFSNRNNWDTDIQNDGKIGPGDLVIFLDDGGAITGSNPDGVIVINSSGLNGNPITLRAEDGATPVIDGENARRCLHSANDDYITVLGMRFTRGNRYGFEAYNCDNWIIEDCIADNSADDNFIFTGNNGIIRRCESYNAPDNGIYLTGDGGSAATNWTVEYCYLHDNTSTGVQINSSSATNVNSGNVIRYNWIEDNANAGINELGSQGADYYGNIIINHDSLAAGMYIDHDGLGTQPDSIQVYNNTFYGNFNYAINIDGNNGGHIIKNNIFYLTNSSAYLYLVASPCSAKFDYNQLYTAGWSGAISYQNSRYNSLSAWQSAKGQDLNSDDSDPLFNNRIADNFALQINSPCIGSGDSVIGTTYGRALSPTMRKADFGPDGSPVLESQDENGNSWEIGAYVYRAYGSDSAPPNPPQGLKVISGS